MELWEHPGSKVGTLVLWASRAEVEAGDISHALTKLRKLLKPEIANRLKGRLIFQIQGYDDDPRDLWEFPEVCAWMRVLDKSFPHWFYFMDLGPDSTLSLIAFSLCKYEKMPNGKRIPPHELRPFFLSHLAAMNSLSKELGESPTENGRRSMDIAKFFFPENEST
jgi:hypothetical protein